MEDRYIDALSFGRWVVEHPGECTYGGTGDRFVGQPFYTCATCGLDNGCVVRVIAGEWVVLVCETGGNAVIAAGYLSVSRFHCLVSALQERMLRRLLCAGACQPRLEDMALVGLLLRLWRRTDLHGDRHCDQRQR